MMMVVVMVVMVMTVMVRLLGWSVVEVVLISRERLFRSQGTLETGFKVESLHVRCHGRCGQYGALYVLQLRRRASSRVFRRQR